MNDKFTLGCDPEFIVHDKKDIFLSARTAFTTLPTYGSVGCDGCDSTAELRPGYSENPMELVSKIGILISWASDQFPEYKFYAGHYKDFRAIGGHIHLSLPPGNDIICNLDCLLGSLSDVIDPIDERTERRKSNYGQLGQYRRQSYGSGAYGKIFGMEYRSPGSWLLSPSIALSNLTLAKIAALNTHIDFSFYLWHIGNQRRFLKNLISIPDIIIPADCIDGLLEIRSLVNLSHKINWKENFIPNWK